MLTSTPFQGFLRAGILNLCIPSLALYLSLFHVCAEEITKLFLQLQGQPSVHLVPSNTTTLKSDMKLNIGVVLLMARLEVITMLLHD
jgi:hypothetical protein